MALLALYEKNKKDYKWNKSVVAVLFFCADENTSRVVHAEIKKDPRRWRQVVEKHMDKVVADSARFEWEQIPGLEKSDPKPGMLTDPLVNETDRSASFAYILQVSHEPIQRSFAEAKGMVINDYQNLLEEEWITRLRKKYPVTVNDKVLEDLVNGK